MKIAACNWKEYASSWQKQNPTCQWLWNSALRPEGTHYKMAFVFGDWFTVAFGPEDTVQHLEYVRVVYSLLAIFIGLVCLALPTRKMDKQVYLTTSVLFFPVYTLILLAFVAEHFPAPSFTFLYLAVSVSFTLSTLTGYVFARFERLGKAVYVLFGAPLFVPMLVSARTPPAPLCPFSSNFSEQERVRLTSRSPFRRVSVPSPVPLLTSSHSPPFPALQSGTIEGHWPYIGMEIGDSPTYNMPYFVAACVAIGAALFAILFPNRFIRDLFFHYATACYFAFAVIAGLAPSVNFIMLVIRLSCSPLFPPSSLFFALRVEKTRTSARIVAK